MASLAKNLARNVQGPARVARGVAGIEFWGLQPAVLPICVDVTGATQYLAALDAAEELAGTRDCSNAWLGRQ